MRRLLSLLIVLSSMVSLFTYTVSAEGNNQDDVFLSTAFVAEADCKIETLTSGEYVIILSNTQALQQVGNVQNYKMTTVAIFPDSKDKAVQLVENISLLKQQALTRGSGSYTDEDWFHSSSVCIKSTVNYYTTQFAGLTYGGITSVYVDCSVRNSTILDDISLRMHQEGYTANNGRKTYDQEYDINNWSTTTAPSSWLGVYWEGGVSSLVGAKVTIKVHRGTSNQYTYSFTNNVIE